MLPKVEHPDSCCGSLIVANGRARLSRYTLRWLFHAAALHADFMTWRRAEFALNVISM